MTKAKLTRRKLLAATCGTMGVSLLSAARSPLRAARGQSLMYLQGVAMIFLGLGKVPAIILNFAKIVQACCNKQATWGELHPDFQGLAVKLLGFGKISAFLSDVAKVV